MAGFAALFSLDFPKSAIFGAFDRLANRFGGVGPSRRTALAASDLRCVLR